LIETGTKLIAGRLEGLARGGMKGKPRGKGRSVRVRATIEARRASKAIGLSLSTKAGEYISPHHYSSRPHALKQ